MRSFIGRTAFVTVIASSACSLLVDSDDLTGGGGSPTNEAGVQTTGDAARGASEAGTPDASFPSTDDSGVGVGLSDVTLSGTGVAVGAFAVATFTAKNATGTRVPRKGATVAFKASGGTSVLDIGPVTDVGDGTYRTQLRGITEGTPVVVSATVDGTPMATPPPPIRVVNPVATGLTLAVDAADADGAQSFGGKGCGGAGLTTWSDLSGNHFNGALESFPAPPCAATSGWNGKGTPEDPYRLTFDGVNDRAAFGAVNALAKQTIIVFVRKQGQGKVGDTGTGGIPQIFPIITKGSAEDEVDAIDVNYYLGITPGGRLGVDFEQSNAPASGNNPLTGNANLVDGTWYMLALTFDPAAASRVLYVNGVFDGSSTTSGIPAGAAQSRLVIGGSDRSTGVENGRFKGDVAIVRTYNRALGATEVAQTCHAYSSRFGIKTCP